MFAALLTAPAFAGAKFAGAKFARAKFAPQPANTAPAKPNRPALRPLRPAGNQEPHLQQWMERHRELAPAEQQRELEKEPGFRDLPAQTQQRYRDRLAQLNNMSPQQRSEILQRNEALERLTPQQQQQFRGAVQQMNALPQPRLRLMRRTILDLRELAPAQRLQVLDSPPIRDQFSPDERTTLRILLNAEPYPPLRNPAP